MNYGHDHGIFPENTEFQIPSDTIHVNGYIDLVALCQQSDMNFEDLKKLNPQITKTSLPHQTRDFVLKVPSVGYTYLTNNRDSIMIACTGKLPSGTLLAKADSNRSDSLGVNQSFPYALVSNDNYTDEEEEDGGTEQVVARNRTKKSTHTVRRGETLSTISRKYRVSVADLRKWNRIRRSAINRGQRLVIYKTVKETAPAAKVAVATYRPEEQAANPARHAKKRYHTVQKGDTLWIISQRYGLEIGQLKKRNNIRGNSIKPGQKLIIST